ncbi:hypothetical protein MKW94_002075 [Papaver nudicaule]|uniref:Ribosomal protein S14 n=1 Tax=Papaver nudicaule TaxID=74823 RepID=A0AA41S5E6_PAPNU|nr:hypothetical protein [Papaver nudicaule]
MGQATVWNFLPKRYGPGSRTCRVCCNINPHTIIREYGLICCTFRRKSKYR